MYSYLLSARSAMVKRGLPRFRGIFSKLKICVGGIVVIEGEEEGWEGMEG